MESKRALIIIPTFNERENIGALIERIFTLHDDVDILIVDDSSKDGTADFVRTAQQRYGPRLRLLSRSGKSGRGSAVLEGFKQGLAGPYEFIMEMDADFSHRPEEIETFFPLMDQFDCVVGSRYLPGSEIRDWGWKRTFFSHLANAFAKTILRIPITDYTNGFRCYTRKAVEAIDPANIDAKGYVVLSETAYQLHKKGFRIGEVPTLFVNRRRGVSNLGFHEINEAFFSVLRIRWPRASSLLLNIGTFLFRGLVAAVIDLLALIILLRQGIPPILCFALSTIVATIVMLFLRKKRWGGYVGLSTEKFLMLYGSIGVLAFILTLWIYSKGTGPILSKAIAVAVLAPVSYLLSRRLLPRE